MGKFRDLTNKRFGRLVAIKPIKSDRHGVRWLCECDCGNQIIRSARYLKETNIDARCIGCNKTKDMTGQRFGKIVVIKRIGSNNRKEATWFCKCDCGGEIITTGVSLRHKQVKSCGCLLGEILRSKALPNGKGYFNQLISQYKIGAKRRNLEWNLTNEQASALFVENCYYCGIEPHKSLKSAYINKHMVHNGIDRKDNNKGYTAENCVPCCEECNRLKRTMSIDEFLEMINRIYLYQQTAYQQVAG